MTDNSNKIKKFTSMINEAKSSPIYKKGEILVCFKREDISLLLSEDKYDTIKNNYKDDVTISDKFKDIEE